MLENVLEKIIQKKSEKITNLKKNISLNSLNEMIDKNKSFINFKEKIENNIKENKFSIIAEIKKASPSAGIIIKDYEPVKIAKTYNSNKASLNLSACLASLTVCTSTITDIFNFKDSSYNSSANLSEIPAKIIKIASAP